MNPKDEAGKLKPRVGLVPPILMIECAGPLTQGAEKYGAFNWREEPISLLGHLEAVLRHIFLYADGEDKADDSGFTHLSHAGAGIAILMDANRNNTLIDDRVHVVEGAQDGQWVDIEHKGNEFPTRDIEASAKVYDWAEEKLPPPEDVLPFPEGDFKEMS